MTIKEAAVYFLLAFGLFLIVVFNFTGTFKIAFEGSGATAIGEALRDSTILGTFIPGILILFVGVCVYFWVFNGNQNREALFTILYVLVFTSLFLSNFAMMSSLFQVIVTPE